MELSDSHNMPPINLTEGAIPMLSNGQAQESNFKPVLQITSIRLINTQNQNNAAVERYRILLSDGVFFQQSMLATQCNDLVRSEKMQKGSIIRLMQYVCNVVQNKRIIIAVDLEVIVEKCDLIGDPMQYPTDGSVPSVVRSPAPRPAMNNPSGGNSPSYSVVTAMSSSAPRSTMGGGIHAPVSGENRIPGQHSYSGSFSGNPRTETVSGMSRPPSSSYGRTPHSYQQPPPMYANRGPISKNEAPARIIPIAALNPYQGRWTIKARVTAKGDLRLYNNARGEGKVFSFDLLDSDGGEIRVTCFNAVADQYYDQIEPGRVYMISRGALKPAQKTFNHLRNDHEIMLDNNSTVQPCFDDDNSIPQQQFCFRPISDIEGLDNNSVVDVIAVVSSISPSSSIMRKNGTETLKRTLQLKDMSGRSVELTLWGNFCSAEGQTLQSMCDSGVFPVLAVKAGRVNDFNGKSVGTISTSQLFIEPDFPEAHKLKAWFANDGKSTPAISISRESSMVRTDARKTISQIKGEKLGTSEKPDWITVSATLTYIKVDNFCYTACPLMIGDRQCNKKVTNNGDGKWRCDRCDQIVDECDYRYILQMQIQDHTGLTWVTAFQESAGEMLGISAKELYYMKYEEQEDEKFTELIRNVLFNKFQFKLKVKEEIFSDEQRVKSTVVKAEKVNFQTETRYLLDMISNLKEEHKNESVITTPAATNITYSGGINNNVSRQGGVGASQVSPYGNNNGSQYGGGSRYNSTGSAGGYMSCNSCGGTGHTTANCPSVEKSYGGGFGNNKVTSGGSGECYKCHQMGHWARDCPGTGNIGQSAYGGSNVNPGAGASGDCFKCHQMGHWARDCPGTGNTGDSAYSGSNVGPGRYGMPPKQHDGIVIVTGKW
ncbi:replication protein A 70 kDa DNA-binding subunit [Striga asiatica]|uniref:Replication protein A subunit n=1 Tax=Striga asiatica TaxID=4170 RepID=A0A5A7RGF5_STRAF|nr:replication protein A 70 kDa DNA-binding subunit [Striga asiatica]